MSTRIKREELRDLLLSEGVALLLDEGVQVGLGSVTFPRVFERVEASTGRRITAASVYERLWASQSDFQWEVLAVLVEGASTLDDRTRRRVSAHPGGRRPVDRGGPPRLPQRAVPGRGAAARHRGFEPPPLPDRAGRGGRGVGARGRRHRRPRASSGCARPCATTSSARPSCCSTSTTRSAGRSGCAPVSRSSCGSSRWRSAPSARAWPCGSSTSPSTPSPSRCRPRSGRGDGEMWSLVGFGVEALVNAMIEVDPDWPGPEV